MRQSTSLRLAALACIGALTFASVRLVADDGMKKADGMKKPGGPATMPAMPGQMDQAAMMAAWEKYATPGPEHAELATWAGEWTLELQDQTPGMDDSKSAGTAKVTMIMGGRYLLEEVKATTMGMPFEGMAITGYDNQRKQYVSTWIDSMGTGVATSYGTASGKTMTMDGEMTCPMMDKPMTTHSTIENESADRRVMNMTMKGPDGSPMGAMRITYLRKK